MAPTIHATLLCNAGLLFRYEDSAILVDALNSPIRSFYAVPERTAAEIIEGAGKFACVDGLFYTHLHPDHYDQAKNAAFLRAHPGVAAFFPTPDTPDHGVLTAGKFTVEYGYLEHTPCEYTWAKHYVLLVSAGGVSVYLTGDASLDAHAHRAFLAGRRADCGFWNAMYLSYPQTRRLMRESARSSFIYHVPLPATDESGICRKIASNYRRYAQELRGVAVLDRYPTVLSITPPEEEIL